MTSLAKGHPAGKWPHWDLDPGLADLGVCRILGKSQGRARTDVQGGLLRLCGGHTRPDSPYTRT